MDEPQDPQQAQQFTPAQMMDIMAQMRDRITQLEGQQAQAPPQVHIVHQPRPLKPERPSAYSGKKSESLDAWIFQVERYFRILNTPQAERVPFAGSLLKDHANMWWRAVSDQIETLAEDLQWDQFKTQLKANFQTTNLAETARARLDKLKQTTSVLLYNTAFRELMLELPNMHEEDRIHAYLKGLKAQIASLVAMQRPTTILDAQRMADTADSIQWQHNPRQFQQTRQYQSPQNYKGPSPMELDAITKLTPAERERLRKTGGCFRCRQTGHLARDCTLTNRGQPRINAITEEETPSESGKE
jgi:hypothetical protein